MAAWIEMTEASSAKPIQTADASQTFYMRMFSRQQALGEACDPNRGESGHEKGRLSAAGKTYPYRQSRAVGVISPYGRLKGELHPH